MLLTRCAGRANAGARLPLEGAAGAASQDTDRTQSCAAKVELIAGPGLECTQLQAQLSHRTVQVQPVQLQPQHCTGAATAQLCTAAQWWHGPTETNGTAPCGPYMWPVDAGSLCDQAAVQHHDLHVWQLPVQHTLSHVAIAVVAAT